MIIKVVKSQEGTRTARGLIKYISQESKGHNPEITMTNLEGCMNLTSAIGDIEQLQKHNTRVKSEKTLHLVVSFAPGELPDKATLSDIEHNIAIELGLAKNQRVSALHTDTESAHLHIAINKINSIDYKSNNLPYSHSKLSKLATVLEKKHGLVRIERDFSERKIIQEELKKQWEQENLIIDQKQEEYLIKAREKTKLVRDKYDQERQKIKGLLSLANTKSMKNFYYSRFSQIHKEQKKEYEALYNERKKELAKIAIEKCNFSEWLHVQSVLKDNKKAQSIYLGKSVVKNEITDPEGNVSREFEYVDNTKIDKRDHDFKNRNGELVYRVGEQYVSISKDTTAIQTPKKPTTEALIKGLDLAIKNYGNVLNLSGDSEFINGAIKQIAINPNYGNVSLKNKDQQLQLELERDINNGLRRRSNTSSRSGNERIREHGNRSEHREYSGSRGGIRGWDPLSDRRKRKLLRSLIQRRRNSELNNDAKRILGGSDTQSGKLSRIGRLYKKERAKREESINRDQGNEYGGSGNTFANREQYLSDMPVFNVANRSNRVEVLLPTDEKHSLEFSGQKVSGQRRDGDNKLRRDRHLDGIPSLIKNTGLNLDLVNYITERNEKKKIIPSIKKHMPVASLNIKTEEVFIIKGTREKGRLLLLERSNDAVRYVLAVDEYAFNRSKKDIGGNVSINKDMKVTNVSKKSIKKR